MPVQKVRIGIDADNERIIIHRVDINGSDVASYPKIIISLVDVVEATAADSNVEVKLRWTRFLDASNGCAPMKQLILASDPVPDT